MDLDTTGIHTFGNLELFGGCDGSGFQGRTLRYRVFSSLFLALALILFSPLVFSPLLFPFSSFLSSRFYVLHVLGCEGFYCAMKRKKKSRVSYGSNCLRRYFSSVGSVLVLGLSARRLVFRGSSFLSRLYFDNTHKGFRAAV